MNRCPDIELELAAYCSGELEAGTRNLVQDHLDVCPACRAELAREMNLRRSLGSLPPVTAPAGLTDSIQKAVHSAGTRRKPTRGIKRRIAAAALIAAGLAAAALLPPAVRDSGRDPRWTQAEMDAARQDVRYTLALTAEILDRTHKDAVVNVFADKLPKAIDESFKAIKPTTSGGNG